MSDPVRAPLGFTELREHMDDVLEPFDDEETREPQDLPPSCTSP